MFLVLGFNPANAYEEKKQDYILSSAVVSEINNVQLSESGKPLEQLVEVEVKDGPHKGETLFVHNLVPDNQAYSIIAEMGKKYIIAIDGGDSYITDYYRQPVIIFLILLFSALLILLGGMKGLKALISLVLTLASIIYILLPSIKAGLDPLLMAILISAIATASTMLLVAGYNKKSLAATLGTTGGVAVGGFLAIIMIKLATLTGYASTEARILMGNLGEEATSFDFQGVLAAGILIASLGAAMDVAISIASSAQEIHLSNPGQSAKELFTHCMNVGKDIMGTMTNTLVLAYTGSAIPLFLLLMDEPMLKVLNMEIIATELSSAIIGSIGLLLSIPITASLSVFLLKRS